MLKNITLLFAMFMGLFANKNLHAQSNSEEQPSVSYNSLLWEISGNGLDKPSYLYGTIHLMPSKDFIISDVVKEKFEDSKQLALEIDMDDPMLMMQAMSGLLMKNGVTLDDLLTPPQYEAIKAYYEDSLGLPMVMIKRIKPMLISGLAMEQSNQGEVESYEMTFVEMAKAQEIEVLGLESAQYQINVIDSIPYELQAEMLLESLNEDSDAGLEVFDTMVELYKNQDLDGLFALIQDEDSQLKDFEATLLNNRNKNWIPVIGKLAKDKTTFIAVGAGHLPGDYGVINLLRKEGYTVKPLKDEVRP